MTNRKPPPKTKGQSAYMKKLRDPRWQKRRLEVLEKADWTCEWCHATKRNLQVHHAYYAPRSEGMDPWDYADGSLWCLCDPCHKKAESVKQELYKVFAHIGPWYHHHVRDFILELATRLEQGQEVERGSPPRPIPGGPR